MRAIWGLLLILLALCASARGENDPFAPVTVDSPAFLLWNMAFPAHCVVPRQMRSSIGDNVTLSWTATGTNGAVLDAGQLSVQDGAKFDIQVTVGDTAGTLHYEFVWDNDNATVYRTQADYRAMPGVLCLLPPVLAIVLVVLLREATLGLFFGVWMGAMLLSYFNPLTGFLDSISVYFVKAWTDLDNGEVVVFALFLGGWTALIRRSGGFQDLTQKLMSRLPLSSRSAAITVIVLGCIVQLSGHLSIFLLGSSCVDLADQTHLSRDKLALLIDSTAAPVASLSLVSSFMAVQTAYIEQEFKALGYTLYSPFEAFVVSIPQGFYQINILALCVWVSIFQKDLFTMYQPERDARLAVAAESHSSNLPGDVSNGSLLISDENATTVAPSPGDEGKGKEEAAGGGSSEPQVVVDVFRADPQFPWRWWNAVVPFAFMLIVTLVSVFVVGLFNARAQGIANPSFTDLLSKSRAVRALLWGMLSSTALVFIMLLFQGRKLVALVDDWYEGCKSMLPAMIMLVVAWALSEVVQTMSLGYFVGSILSQGLPAGLLPTLVVILSVFISFASGTSFGTMGVIFPICIPVAYQLRPDDGALMITTIAACIAGSNCGDHCSPFSDTTILSALMSGIPNLQHTKTQFPYAVLSCTMALLFGFLPVGFGLNPWVANLIQIALLGVIVFLFGKKVGNYSSRDRQCTAHDDTSLFMHGWHWARVNVLRRRREDYQVL